MDLAPRTPPRKTRATPLRPTLNELRRLDGSDLCLLLLLLEGDTLGATAGHLGLTQPAVSQRLRKLEDLFGVELLHRVGRTVRLTPSGRRVSGRAARALALLEQLLIQQRPQLAP